MTNLMRFASAISTEPYWDEAVNALSYQLRTPLEGHAPDLTLIFVSGHPSAQVKALAERLAAELETRICLGCTAEGVIGAGREIERQSAIAAAAACLPDVGLTPFHIQPPEWRGLLADAQAFRQKLGAPSAPKLFILLADPFSSPMDEVLDTFNALYPGVPLIGGMASGAAQPGHNALFTTPAAPRHGLNALNSGAVGVVVSGAIEADVVVSQGCRPIGYPLRVTTAKENVIFRLEGQPPLEQIQKLFEQLPIGVIQQTLGETQLAGFFCAGEIGPIGGKNFLHGHTASLVLFRPSAS